jgi:[ribosomal protein S5]-alanine N-acetyltransferase
MPAKTRSSGSYLQSGRTVEQGVILETVRLRLREFTHADADALAAVLGDPVAMQFYPSPFDRQGVETWIARNQERYRLEGHGLWAMLLRDTGELIGDCGCTVQEVEGKNEVEVGYHVRRDLWGNGYATEAAQACMEYAFARLGAKRVISIIRPENAPSRRVAEKNGLVCEKIVFWRGYDHYIYAKRKG